MRNRQQKGYIYRKNGSWFVRYYDSIVQPGGLIARKAIAQRLASVSEYPRKTDVKALVEDFLAPINAGQFNPTSTMTLGQFVESIYLPHVVEQCRPSTSTGYRDIWNCHLKPRCGQFRLRDFRTYHGERVLRDIARQNQLTRTTLRHFKALLSGIFKHAKRQGLLNGVNPMQDVSIPKAKEPNDTHAYSLEEIFRMIAVLPTPASVVVGAAAFTGTRRGELRGFAWEHYVDGQIRVSQSIWRGHITPPKTRKSEAPIPVIAPLAELLRQHRVRCGNPASGLMFTSGSGNSLDLADLARRVIRPALKEAGLEWHGWHAFRRGLATNLYRLGVPDKTIQAILRHSNISTTMNCYVKSVPADAAAAMGAFESLWAKYAPKYAPISDSAEKRVM